MEVEQEQLILFDGKYVFKFENENKMDNSPKHKEKVVQLINNNLLPKKKVIILIINGVENSKLLPSFLSDFSAEMRRMEASNIVRKSNPLEFIFL